MIVTDKNTKGEIVSLIALACVRLRGNNCSQFPPGVKVLLSFSPESVCQKYLTGSLDSQI